MSLQNLQAEIAEAITQDQQPAELLNSAANLIIYQNNIQSVLLRALKNAYPLNVKLMGEDYFNIIAKDYITSYPSISGILDDYGDYFSDFIKHYQPLQHLAYLYDVAKFEWACHRIINMAEHNNLDLSILANASPEQYQFIHFGLSPACEIFYSDYPILQIIDLCKNNSDRAINLNEGKTYLIIYRKQFNISLMILSLGEYTFLNALQQNLALSESLDMALDCDSTFKLDEKLPLWIKRKIIVDCQIIENK